MKKYYKSLEEHSTGKFTKTPDVTAGKEKNLILDLFGGETTKATASRRDFLKLCGFSVGTAALVASCEQPVHKAIPYLVRPEEIIPGKANYYASSYIDGKDYSSILLKVRDGRPIKIEGNDLSSFNRGGTTARVQASVLSLYDEARYHGPLKNGESTSWDEADKEIMQKLESLSAQGKRVLLISSTIISPSTQKAIDSFFQKYPGEHIQYDVPSMSAMLDANEEMTGMRIMPGYFFGKAKVIASFGADFLGTWVAPSMFASDYAKAREVTDETTEMPRHIQFETGYTITGSKADNRYSIKPSDQKKILAKLHNYIALKTGDPLVNESDHTFDVSSLGEELLANKGKSLVVCGVNDKECQMLANAINTILDNYGETLSMNTPCYLRKGNDSALLKAFKNINEETGAVIFFNVNPVFNHPLGKELAQKLKKTELTISLANAPCETDLFVNYICPDNHLLESWNDALPLEGMYSLAQPGINAIYKTRQAQDTLLTWSGSDKDYLTLIKETWKAEVYPLSSADRFDDFWVDALQKGVFEVEKEKGNEPYFNRNMLAISPIKYNPDDNGIDIEVYENVGIGNGSMANNPWLQELPEPVSKVCWDNFAAVSPALASEYQLQLGDVIELNGLSVPVLIQPGQARNSISIAMGYGHTHAGKVANGVGVNPVIFEQIADGNILYYKENISPSKTGLQHEFALTQTHHSMEGREIVREATLAEFQENIYAGNKAHLEYLKHKTTLYEELEMTGYHWGMAVDLTKCTGCSSCVIACQAENNVPVIGKEQVKNRRIMHWMRIDRYYSDDPENPEMLHQPVMCQHCDHAPCENVCPVSATNHSVEGINQMSYNRCIGTKYCINNCPYKVRRFNWFKYVNNEHFDYNQNSEIGKMVLNPDVTVRERGVVEKCSFCIQRIQEKKQQAKLENRMLNDQEVKPACMQTCPSGALMFGDLNNPESEVSKLVNSGRNYHLLEQLHTLPTVSYLTLIRNKKA